MRVKEEFEKRKRKLVLFSFLGWIIFILFVSFQFLVQNDSYSGQGFWAPFICLLVFELIFYFFIWRCPSCDDSLGIMSWDIKFCPKCGVQLRD